VAAGASPAEEKRAVARNVREWIADRFGWNPFRRNVLDRRVARTPWYYGDGATLTLLLGVLVVTGIAMTFTYTPSPDAAYDSVRHITERQVLGWFVRGLHYWSAGLMMIMLLWHVLRQVLVAGYKFPREGTWLIGVVLFVLVTVMSFTGYVLRWDERGIHAMRVALQIFGRIPLMGDNLVLLIQGGSQPGGALLTRIFALHVILIPVLLFVFVTWHVYLVILHGVTSKGERKYLTHTTEQQRRRYKAQAQDEEQGETFYPDTVIQSGVMGMIVLTIGVVLVIISGPGSLMPEANLVERSFPAEEWWWWWFSGLVALLPADIASWFIVVFPLAVLLGMIALPLLDRGPERGLRKRPIVVTLVCMTVVAMVGLSGVRLRSPWTGWPVAEPPALPPGITLNADAERGRQLFARHGCTSCHSVAGAGGREVAVDLARLPVPRSLQELENYIREPPRDVAMPAYGGWATEEEISRLADYVLAAQTFPRRQ
jgi:ubiquinol-cytochrome c reductase cytochrome b subunit